MSTESFLTPDDLDEPDPAVDLLPDESVCPECWTVHRGECV